MVWNHLFWTLVCGLAFAQDEYEEEAKRPLDKEAEFTTLPLKKMINEGDTIRLPCFLDQLEGNVLLWKFGDTILSVAGRVIERSLGSRLELHEETNGNWLVISGAGPEDQGEYMCQISAYQPKDIVHSVVVRTQPQVRIEREGDEVRVVQGETVTLGCSVVRGHPVPEVTWVRPGQERVVGRTLTLERVRVGVGGEYRCRGDNGYSADGSVDSVTLVVEHQPVLAGRQFVHAMQETEATLKCLVTSFPPAKVTWYTRDLASSDSEVQGLSDNDLSGSEGLTLSDNGGLELNMTELNGTTQLHSLTFQTDNSTQDTKFTCLASNKHGNTSRLYTVTTRPSQPEFLSSQEVQGDTTFMLVWSADSHPPLTHFTLQLGGPSLSSKVLVTPHLLDEGVWRGEHLVTDLQPATQYKARVGATNSEGEGPMSDWVNFETEGWQDREQSRLFSSSGSLALPLLSLVIFLSLNFMFDS